MKKRKRAPRISDVIRGQQGGPKRPHKFTAMMSHAEMSALHHAARVLGVAACHLVRTSIADWCYRAEEGIAPAYDGGLDDATGRLRAEQDGAKRDA